MSSLCACWGVRISASSICWLCNQFLKRHIWWISQWKFWGFFSAFFIFCGREEVWQRSKKVNVCQAFFFPSSSSLVSSSHSLFLTAAPEEEGERGAAGGRDPGLREDPHGEEQPPEGSRQDGQRQHSIHRSEHFSFYSSFTREPHGLLMIPYTLCWWGWICNVKY